MHNKRVKLVTRVIVGVMAALVLSLTAHADTLNLSLTTPNQTGSPGDTLVFFGTISNPTATTFFLNGDNLSTNPGPPLFNGNGSAFLLDSPPSLGAGGSTGNLDLFSVMIGASAAPGTYILNSFEVLGGSTSSAQDLLATQQFSITVSTAPTPEPGTLTLLATGASGWMVRAVRRRRSRRFSVLISQA